MLFGMLTAISVILTYAMFQSRNAMLGFPCAIFWALLGGYCYQQSTVAWDLYFLFAFSCLLGMTVFCMLGAYGLREKRDAIGEQEMERGDGEQQIDKKPGGQENWYEDDGVPELDDNLRPRPRPGTRTTARRTRSAKSKQKGEFGF